MLKLHKDRKYYKQIYSSIDFDSRVYINQTGSLTDNETFIYYKLLDLAKSVSSGETYDAVLQLNISEMLGKTSFTASELGIDSVNEKNYLQTADQLFDFDPEKFIYQIGYEYPLDFFWFNKTVDIVIEMDDIRYDNNTLSFPEVINMYLTVSQDYQGAQYYSVDPDAVVRAQKAKEYALEIVEQAKDLSDYDKLLFYRNTICSETNYYRDTEGKYEEPEAYGAPSQMINVFDHDPTTNVWCEGYTKAFQFLCDHTEFESNVWCFTVRGVKNDSKYNHCWNIIHMNDDQFYLTDITVSDVSSTANHMFGFLKGVDSGNIYKGYKTEGNKYSYRKNTRELWLPKMLTIAKQDFPDPNR